MPLHNNLKIDCINVDQEKSILAAIETHFKSEELKRKYRLLFLILIDCGTRISETVDIRLHQINSSRKVLLANTLKKRAQGIYREIPMTQRVVEALAKHWIHLKDKTETAFLFPSDRSSAGHLQRQSVWKLLKKLSQRKVHPHLLRHTCLTRLAANGSDMHTIKAIAGHSSIRMSEQYIHASLQAKQTAIRSIDRSTWLNKWYRKYFPVKGINVLPMFGARTNFHIGRVTELETLIDLSAKKVNVYIQGPQGIGKTHLLDHLEATGTTKFLRIDDLRSVKGALQTMIMYLCNGDKEEVARLLFQDKSHLDQIVTKESNKRLSQILIDLTKRHEYSIIIDDATRITPIGVDILENLNHHFHIIVAARNIKLSSGSFLSNFQKIQLQPLSRLETLEMIQADTDFKERVGDYEQFRNHIWNTAGGNPQFTLEMIDRFRKETYIGDELISDIRHNSAIKELDMTLPLIIILSSLMVLRYMAGELEQDSGAYRLFGGAFLVFALFARNLFHIGKRRYV